MQRRVAALLFLALIAAVQAGADETINRLETIARVWGAVKFAHPYLGYREEIDWDRAGVEAAERARGSEPLETILADMLDALSDPMTRIESICVEQANESSATISDEWVENDGLLYIPTGALLQADLDPGLVDAILNSRRIIIDTRSPPGHCSSPPLPALEALTPLLLDAPMTLPDQRRVRHVGYRSQDPDFQTGYDVDFAIEQRSIEGEPGANSDASVWFVTNRESILPSLALALLKIRRGAIIAVGIVTEEMAVSHVEIPVGEGHTAIIRTGELMIEGRSFRVGAARTLQGNVSTEEIISAVTELDGRGRRRAVFRPLTGGELPPYTFRFDQTYPEMRYPEFGYRALAAFRLWNVIHYFYGYPQLIGDWDARLPEMLQILIDAPDQREYHLAFARISTFVPDGHSIVLASSVLDLRGRYIAPFSLMPVEGKPVVVGLIDPAASGPVALGDELIEIDDRPVADRYQELEPYISASTASAKEYYLTSLLPNGPATTVRFSFRKPDGTVYVVEIQRGIYQSTPPVKPWSVLDGKIGYVDLRWLEANQVDAMIDELFGTRGLIIDTRSYPRGVFARLGRRLNTAGQPANVANFLPPVLTGGVKDFDPYVQNIGSSNLPVYTKRCRQPHGRCKRQHHAHVNAWRDLCRIYRHGRSSSRRTPAPEGGDTARSTPAGTRCSRRRSRFFRSSDGLMASRSPIN